MDKTIFGVMQECNDKGWSHGYHFFENANDAIKCMRDYVARTLRYAKQSGQKIEFFKVFSDTVTWDTENNTPSQSINVKIDGNFFEWRVFAFTLHDKPLGDVVNF